MNPFKYGTVGADRYFIDREKDIARIKDDLLNGINIILYALRRNYLRQRTFGGGY